MADIAGSPDIGLQVGGYVGLNFGANVGVVGASSLVGAVLLPLLSKSGAQITAFSRSAGRLRLTSGPPGSVADHPAVAWRQLSLGTNSSGRVIVSTGVSTDASTGVSGASSIPLAEHVPQSAIAHWICLAPLWVLPSCFELLRAHGAKRVVVLSSTSVFAKRDSADPQEQATAQRLAKAEQQLREWADARGVQWVILRPTLIYGAGQDKNISEIARFIRRFGFFPVFGNAQGQRQPIHAADVATACIAALQRREAAGQAYNISGGETLAYYAMVTRVFEALARRPRMVRIPLWAFRLAVAAMRRLPRYRLWSAAMAERMGRDLVFDHADAARDLGFKPRSFLLAADDLPT